MNVKLLNNNATLPTRGTSNSAGLDLYCTNDQVLEPGLNIIPLGISVEIPDNFYGRIADRSSMASRSLHIFAGVVDSDYRGEVKVIMFNFNQFPITIDKGSRVAQLIIEPYSNVTPIQVLTVTDTTRTGGFGSTGV